MSQNATTQNGLDGYAETTVQCAVSRLITKFGFPEQEREDLEQDLRLYLLTALKEYDSTRAKRSTFIKDCVENRVFNLLRDRRRIRRDPRRVGRLGDEDDGDSNEVSASSLSDRQAGLEQGHSDLRMDLAAVIAALPQRQRDICALLPNLTLSRIAQQLCIHRQTVHRDLKLIRAAFDEAGLADYLG